MFKFIRPILRIAAAVEQIADALTYFATVDARLHNRMFVPKRRGWLRQPDQSELLHTDPTHVEALHAYEADLLRDQGYSYLEAEDARDD